MNSEAGRNVDCALVASHGGVVAAREDQLAAGARLEYFTLGWNALEAVVAVLAGQAASSLALLGFGLDSVIECLSGAVLLWRLRPGRDRPQVERQAQRLVAISFVLLAAWVAWQAGRSLLLREPPESSLPGIVLAAASVVVMPILARAKRRVARSLGSVALAVDSRQTDVCAYLSVILLLGLLLNEVAGWWWADPAAALGMVPIMLAEGIRAWRGHTSCGC